jgi:NAD(P)-dependent dehydrogenase (short-subunit alcohol dehydrogenase family)
MTSKYHSAHQTPQGPNDARPTAHQIITDSQLHGKWADRTILITGTSSGLGIETARALLDTGATLYLTARDVSKAKAALGDILSSPRAKLLELDLSSLSSVRACADAFTRSSSRLNVLIANAGVMAAPQGRTADGHETHFGTNHLAHFLLIQLLLPTLEASSTPAFASRVVLLSSSAHRLSGVNLDNLNFDREGEAKYDPLTAYAQSKTANLLTANELDRRYAPRGVRGLAVHPGLIVTPLMQYLPPDLLKAWAGMPTVANALKSVEQGAATSVWAATAGELEGRGGVYLEDVGVAGLAGESPMDWEPGYAAHARDEEMEGRLWERSVEMVGAFLL